MSSNAPRRRLRGRRSECEALDRLVADAKAGRSQVLVLRGEPGVGKSALLEHVLGRAAGCRRLRAAGVESEMELAFAGLHQLCPHRPGGRASSPGQPSENVDTFIDRPVNAVTGLVPDRQRVVMIPSTREDKAALARLFQQHQGHAIHYFGFQSAESLSGP